MKSIKDDIKNINYNFNEILKKKYLEALSNKDFEMFVRGFDMKGEDLLKYTSKLQESFEEVKNCSTCTSLDTCPNSIKGFCFKGLKYNEKLEFKHVACDKKIKSNNTNAYKKNIILFDGVINEGATLANVIVDDPNRKELLMYVKSFLDGNETKGLYVSGNFGCGKTFIVSALVNELAKKGKKCVFVHYPEYLRTLKSSFSDPYEYNNKFNVAKNAEILVLDDIGAENVTAWGRDEILGTILQYRMDNNLVTIFTSNFKIDELNNHLANTREKEDTIKALRITERIKYLCKEIELVSINRRN